MFIQSDAAREDEVEAVVEQIVKRYGQLDVGINNVGNMVRRTCSASAFTIPHGEAAARAGISVTAGQRKS